VKDYKNKWAKDKRANASPKFCTICNAKLLDHRAVRCDQCRKKYNQEYRSNWAKEKAKQGVGK
jgi:predicted amidophosphoribosyltransferase